MLSQRVPSLSVAMHVMARPSARARRWLSVGLDIAVCHLPPGTSKWNKIQHRLFSFITINWRGKPLVSLETIVSLIAATKTRSGLEVYARLDDGSYPDKISVPDAQLKAVNLHGDDFHPEWNYRIKPRR